jgi:polyisoprenoid-binding protein YceI
LTASQSPGSRSRLPIAIGIAVVAVLLLGAAGVAYMFTGSAPAAVSLDATPSDAPSAASSSAAAESSASADGQASPASSAAAGSTASSSTAGAAGAGSLHGTWKVDTSIGSFSDFSSSFVGYRVQEQLASVGAQTAVGRTPNVSGTITLQGDTITAAKITADLTTLQSDRPMRDGQLSHQAIQTSQYPTATFELTSPIKLSSTPADGGSWTATAQGKLTLHGVTRDVSIPLQAKLSGGVVTVIGSLNVPFADYNISPPQSMMVLSVADNGTMELQLHFTKG